MSCLESLPSPLNSVASGVNSFQANVDCRPHRRRTAANVVLRTNCFAQQERIIAGRHLQTDRQGRHGDAGCVCQRQIHRERRGEGGREHGGQDATRRWCVKSFMQISLEVGCA